VTRLIPVGDVDRQRGHADQNNHREHNQDERLPSLIALN
jgi:hypothetical protein